MSIIETLLIFAGIPLAVIAAVAGSVYAGSARRGKRYRPGRAYDFTPVWFLAAPERQLAVNGSRAITAPRQSALEAASKPTQDSADAGEWPATDKAERDVTGGASDRW